MEMPLELRVALENQLQDMNLKRMVTDSQSISLRYRTQSGKGERLLTSDSEALSYAAARMPATYGAVYAALRQTIAKADRIPLTMLDVGAGTGAASWAAAELLDLRELTCLEREGAMRRLGSRLMENGPQALRDAKWLEYDLDTDPVPCKADLVTASYVLNEMSEDGRKRAIDKLWDSAQMILLLVEPGTPAGFSHLNEARRQLLDRGAHIAAPCPHEADCPKSSDDWCHFACRVARTRLHKQLKGGEAPYEDEKFSYLAFVRVASSCGGMRVLRHPQVRGGHVMLEVCTADGIKEIKLTKKDGERYKKARKAETGDELV
jgi:ribosomal protein RSM22 (predicted rRNA methylase)